MKKLLTVIVCLCLIVTLAGLLPIHNEAKIYDSVLRLHVVANSDSDADQALKLEVRDAVIELGQQLLSECRTLEDTQNTVANGLEQIRQHAENEVRRLGYDYDVEVRLGNEQYPAKQYGSLCFPSGEYTSLQVLIGEAAGQNWWCVLFPPLCLSAASVSSTNEDAFIQVGLNSEQYKIITETKNPAYEARFKILEALEEVF